jgi:predicted Fe-Mo cluster-binding NifX family protein
MRLAIATENGKVSPHFGHCEMFTIVDIENEILKSKEELSSAHNDCGSLPQLLGEKGVQCIITGGIGGRPMQLFSTKGIKVVPGVSGTIDEVIAAYIAGNLQPGNNLCDGGCHDEGNCHNQ